MKLVRYGTPGAEKPGIIGSDGYVRDLSDRVLDIAGETLSERGLDALRELEIERLPVLDDRPQETLRLGPCVGGTGKFVCIGLNYADHAAETGSPIPPEPVIFGKWTSAISGPDDDVVLPRGSRKTDWEVELGVVIGEEAAYVDEADALGHVAGYCVVNDVSEREYQLDRGGTWDKGKGCDTFGPVGPWLVTRDEIDDLGALSLWLDVDGVRRQDCSTASIIFSVPFLVAYCSRFMRLQPGDIISTGTPPGVGMGRTPQTFLRGGETMRLGIDGLGVQTQYVRRA